MELRIPEGRPTVLVIDDDYSVRKSLGRLLKTAGHRVETYASAEEFLATAGSDGPGCVICDVKMPGLDGLELQAALSEHRVSWPIIFITGHGDVPTSVHAMKVGAVDFLTKPCDGAELLAAVDEAIEIDRRNRRDREDVESVRRKRALLTPREREVMELVVTGMLNKQIAFRLGTSEKTIKVHRARVFEKMEARSVAELVRLFDQLAAAEAG